MIAQQIAAVHWWAVHLYAGTDEKCHFSFVA